jgi:predicted Kef-type K+ transport protein
MLERLKRALVDSYIGAIALGWVLAQDIMHFVGIFSAPVASWVSQNTYREMTQKTNGLAGFPFQDALPELVRAFLLLMVWSVLIRWLYSDHIIAHGSRITRRAQFIYKNFVLDRPTSYRGEH